MRIIQPHDLPAAARALEDGKLVVVPTSRWYMICADASDAEACGRIFQSKQRPTSKPLALVTPSLTSCEQTFRLTSEARLLAEAFWPGDLALMLPWREPERAARMTAVGSPALVTMAPGVLGGLAALARVPLAATTINVSGNAGPDDPGPAITLDDVREFLSATGLEVALAIDGGTCPAANHMTIVDCFTAKASLIRTGLVHQRALSTALGRDIPAA
ncbi:L-threonylcarbamoyladenylate synthase [Streptomyces aidingensis]|nr:Sua5/YciO/YrdC/YwlC family protein [Streptomyces aidingensis]